MIYSKVRTWPIFVTQTLHTLIFYYCFLMRTKQKISNLLKNSCHIEFSIFIFQMSIWKSWSATSKLLPYAFFAIWKKTSNLVNNGRPIESAILNFSFFYYRIVISKLESSPIRIFVQFDEKQLKFSKEWPLNLSFSIIHFFHQNHTQRTQNLRYIHFRKIGSLDAKTGRTLENP